MKIAIFGTGGVGGYFGGRLAEAGEEVAFIARGSHLHAIRAQGLRVSSTHGDFVVQPALATDSPAEIGPVDLVIVAVKAWQVPEAAEAIRPLMGAETVVLPLQNGMDAPEQLAALLGAGPVLGGLCRVLSFVAEPGHIRHVAIEPYIALGERGGGPSERVARIQRLLQRAHSVTVEVPSSIEAAMWAKFLFISTVSGVGAATRAPLDQLVRLPETRTLLEETVAEIAAVAAAHGIELPEGIVARTLAFIESLPAGSSASMQRDIMEARPSELDAQTGAVLRFGEAVGVPTPINRFLYQTLLPQEQRARGLLTFPL